MINLNWNDEKIKSVKLKKLLSFKLFLCEEFPLVTFQSVRSVCWVSNFDVQNFGAVHWLFALLHSAKISDKSNQTYSRFQKTAEKLPVKHFQIQPLQKPELASNLKFWFEN